MRVRFPTRVQIAALSLLVVGSLVVGGARPAVAAQPEDCPKWFPDFQCDRSGRYEGFQMPIVQPYLFEDPFIVTGLYPYYVYHEFPGRSAFQGGEVHIAALQARIAITDRLAFIATKDGRAWERPDNPLLSDQDGWMNLAGGLKYAFIDNPDDRFILSGSLRAEFSTGSSDIFEGGNDAQIIPGVSAAWGPMENLHLIGALGGRIPTDGDTYGSSVHYHVYADYQVAERFQPFVQISGIRYIESGDGTRDVRLKNGPTITLDQAQHALNTGHFEGVDVHNLGSRGVDNNDYITWAVGAHVPITKHIAFSAAYERPLTNRKDITKQRVTVGMRFEF
jgi:hypothetical protein